MAMDRVQKAVNILQEAGISAVRGYPPGEIPALEEVMAAVTLETTDRRQIQLAVTLFGPGSWECEQKAQTAADLLRQGGFICEVGACGFQEDSHLFFVKVRAVWKLTLHNRVLVDDKILSYATAFSAVQTRQVQLVEDTATGSMRPQQGEKVWTLAVQEWLPFREPVTADQQEAFLLRVMHENCTEVFPDCRWISITLEEGDGGLVRKRIARTWAERIIQEEP